MFTFPIGYFSSVIGGNLDAVLPGETVFQINPIVGANTKQLNVILNPADSELQTAYDFFPGLDGTDTNADPLFVAGSPNHMLYDSDDCQTLVGTNTAFLNNLHKTTGGQACTMMAAFRTDATLGSTQTVMGSLDLSDHGVRLIITAANNIQFQQRGPGSNNWALAAAVASTDYLVFVGFDLTTSATDVEHWINTSTGTTDTDDIAGTDIVDPTGDQFRIGATADPTPAQFLLNGFRTYEIAMFNKVLSDAEVALAKANVEARLGIIF